MGSMPSGPLPMTAEGDRDMHEKCYAIRLVPWRQQWLRFDSLNRLLLCFCLLLVGSSLAKWFLSGHVASDSLLIAGLCLLSFNLRYFVSMRLHGDKDRDTVARYLEQRGFSPQAQGWVRRVLMLRQTVWCEGGVLIGPRIAVERLRRVLIRNGTQAG